MLTTDPFPITQVICQLLTVEALNNNVQRIVLRAPVGTHIDFHPGQYLDVLFDDGTQCAFSIANTPNAQRDIEIHFRYVADSKRSNAMRQLVERGDTIRIELPKGQCILERYHDRTPLIFLAGSTGFAPLKSIIERCIEERVTRPIHLYWGARIADDFYLPKLPQQWADHHPNIHYVPVVSDAPPAQPWAGRTGLVHESALEDIETFDKATVFACGSPAMVYAAFDAFCSRGMKPEQMRSDVFEYAPRQ